MTFGEYYDFIYLNTTLPKQDILRIAVECWNKGYDKYTALEKAKELYKGA